MRWKYTSVSIHRKKWKLTVCSDFECDCGGKSHFRGIYLDYLAEWVLSCAKNSRRTRRKYDASSDWFKMCNEIIHHENWCSFLRFSTNLCWDKLLTYSFVEIENVGLKMPLNKSWRKLMKVSLFWVWIEMESILMNLQIFYAKYREPYKCSLKTRSDADLGNDLRFTMMCIWRVHFKASHKGARVDVGPAVIVRGYPFCKVNLLCEI